VVVVVVVVVAVVMFVFIVVDTGIPTNTGEYVKYIVYE